MKKCYVCGAQVDGNELYCPYCGAYLAEQKNTYINTQKNQAAADDKNNLAVGKYVDFIDTDALYKLALCKLSGIGVDKNEHEAFEIFQKLAFRGHYDSMYKLAEMYLAQNPQEEETACMWLKIAADAGHEQSKIRLKVLKRDSLLNTGGYNAVDIPHEAGEFETLVRKALPSVVLIKSTYVKGRKQKELKGAGFIVEGGFVITNAHVVGDNPECVTANFEPEIDEKNYNLLPIVVRPEYDIAVLRFTGLAAEKINTQHNLQLRAELPGYGEEVYTIGNPLGYGFSVSKGVVSCPNRESYYPRKVDCVIQIDITINHGNSGGALLDRNNNVLGMVTYIPGKSEGGISMCVPAKYIVEVLNSLS